MPKQFKERPILMHARSIKGILEGRKTQTRRIIKPQPPEGWNRHCWFDAPIYGFTWQGQPATDWHKARCPYISSDELVGNRLWVRETFFIDDFRYEEGPLPKERPDIADDSIYYRADGECCDQIPECQCADAGKPHWKPGIHMPRWASRLTLQITNISVEKVQSISCMDIKAEGCLDANYPNGTYPADFGWEHRLFKELWDATNGAGAWDRNDWVWVIEFRRIS